ncbi:MAG TPA: AMP-binding protein [Acidimicrobiia bacterium]|nr:AMP-binding protein [Acidimicrobiia bacterium]
MLHIAEMLANAARVAPDSVAVTLDDDALTFGEIEREANRIANGLRELWVGRGDRVLWWGDTSLDAVPVFAALAKIGAVFAPLNARSSLAEVSPVAEYARPRLLLTGASHTDAGAELAAQTGIPFSPVIPLGSPTATDSPTAAGLDERDPHVIFFTSGSTGRPKGVVLSHRTNWLRTYVGATTTAGGAGTVCMFPLFHMAGWTIAMGAWQGRRPVHFVRTPDAETLLHTTARHRAARLYCIPAVWARILEHGVGKFDLSSLEEADTGTSATPPELLLAVKDALPHTCTRVFYGSTEAGPGVQLGDADLARKPGSVGVAQPGVEVRLAENGEVTMRSPFLMDGYFDDPDATAEALRDGWYHTGDLGAFDDEGYLSIVGRARDVIRTGGETVAPPEVEDVLSSHPSIDEVAVVGVPDPKWGEVVTAVVVLRAGAKPPDLDAIREFCAGRLAPFKQPRRLAVVDSLPRTTATGQVQRTLIVERLQT